MGAVIGIIIFIALVYNIIISLKSSVEERAEELLEKAYKAIKSQSEIVKKLPNGLMWKTNKYGPNGHYMDIYITVEERKNMDSVFLRVKDDDRKYGFFFRYVNEMSEEEFNSMTNEIAKENITNLNKYASICNPLITQPFITKVTKRDSKKIFERSQFSFFSDEDIDNMEKKFKELGEKEAIRRLTFNLLDKYDNFVDEYFEYISR